MREPDLKEVPLTVAYRNRALTLLENPDEDELRANLPVQVVPKILRHLDPATGHWERGEVQCTKILNVVFNPWTIEVFYATRRPDGKEGTQFMRFYPWSAAMRCLAVTVRGDAVKDELFEESGCRLTAQSRVLSLGAFHMDDGVFSDPLSLLVVDRLEAPEEFSNPAESIRGIRLMHWWDWYPAALNGELDDVFASFFAARCGYDPAERRVIVEGRHEILRDTL
jgi:hypothetical protein